MHKRIVTRR